MIGRHSGVTAPAQPRNGRPIGAAEL